MSSTEDVVVSHTHAWSDEKKAQYAEYISTQRLDYEPVIQAGDRVVLKTRKTSAFFHLRVQNDQRVKMKHINVKNHVLVGHPYYSTFNDKGERKKDSIFSDIGVFEELDNLPTDEFVPTNNNAELFDQQDNQTVSSAQVLELKAQGKSPEEIIRIVAAGSKTFASKTEFSQKKWLRKMLLKHNHDFTIMTTTPANVLEAMLIKDRHKVLTLRDDMLAHIIQFSGAYYGSRPFIVDSTSGLILGSLLRKVDGAGQVVSCHVNQSACMQMVEEFNLPGSKRMYHTIPLGALSHLHQTISAGLDVRETYSRMLRPQGKDVLTPYQESQIVSREVLKDKMDSLIVVTHHDPLAIVQAALPFIRPSSPITVYCEACEPLARLEQYLRTDRMAVNVRVVDLMGRRYTIAPNISHPEMTQTHGASGFLLTAITL